MAKRLIVLVVLSLVLPATALAATVHVRVEGKTKNLFAPTEVTVTASNALDAIGQQASLLGEFYYHVTAVVVRSLRRPDRLLPRRRLLRLGLQGERRLAAHRRRPGAAEERRPGALVLGRRSAPPAARRPCSWPAATKADEAATRVAGPGRPARKTTAVSGRSGAARGRPDGRHEGGCRLRRQARRVAHARDWPCWPGPSAPTSCGEGGPCRAILLLALRRSPAAAARATEGTATLWITHDRGSRGGADARTVPAGETDGIQALAEQGLKVTTRYGGQVPSSRSRRDRRNLSAARRDWFYFVNGIEGRPRRRRLPAAVRATWRASSGGTTARGRSAEGRGRRSSAPSPSRSSTGYGGRTRPAVVVGRGPGHGATRALRLGSPRRSAGPWPPTGRPPARPATCSRLVGKPPRFTARIRKFRSGVLLEFVFAGDALRLAADPTALRRPLPVRAAVNAVPAAILLAGLGAAALLAQRRASGSARALICSVLLAVCRFPRAQGAARLAVPDRRARRPPRRLWSCSAAAAPGEPARTCRSGAGRRCRCSGRSTSPSPSCRSPRSRRCGSAPAGSRSRPTRSCSTTTGSSARPTGFAAARPWRSRSGRGSFPRSKGQTRSASWRRTARTRRGHRRGTAGSGAARLAARGRVARAGVVARGGDGGARLRAPRPHAGAAAGVGEARLRLAIAAAALVVVVGSAVALAVVDHLRFSYPGGIEAVRGVVTLAVEEGERVAAARPVGRRQVDPDPRRWPGSSRTSTASRFAGRVVESPGSTRARRGRPSWRGRWRRCSRIPRTRSC